MTSRFSRGRPLPVPSSRLGRLAGLGFATAGIAGRTLLDGARRLSQGQLPDPTDLLLAPANLVRMTDELARMRGAAMKVGQLMSMDAGEVLPPEFADLMARLRADADFMPVGQLSAVLQRNWGPDWHHRFERFDMRPLAAASIGQVHRARTTDGRDLAVKVQYPGVAGSIDADIDNVTLLFRMTGLAPPAERLSALTAEAKRQLRREADYRLEADHIRAYCKALTQADEFALPQVQDDLTTDMVLAMSFVPGKAIEHAAIVGQDIRDRIVHRLLRLCLRELFEFRLMQTDPNFANYTYDPATDRVGLLDFGATQQLSKGVVEHYRRLIHAGFKGDRAALRGAALDLGLFSRQTQPRHRDLIVNMMSALFATLASKPVYDFRDDGLFHRLQRAGMELATDPQFTDVPPMETLYLQRKVGGMYLLGRRLRARVPLRDLIGEYVDLPSAV